MSNSDKGSSLTRSLASSWLALGVGIVVSFFLSPFVVNKLGAAWYGVWAVAGQFIGYMYVLDFGVRESVIRYTSKYAARGQRLPLNRVLTTALTLYVVVSVFSLAGVALCIWRVPYWLNLENEYWHDTRWAVALAGLTIAQTFLFNVFTGVVMGLRRWDIANSLGIAWNLLRAALVVYFLGRGYGIVALAAIQCAVSLLSGVVNAAIAVALLRSRSLSIRRVLLGRRRFVALSRRILGYGLHVIVTNIGEKLIFATDTIIVGIFLPIQSVAYYAIAGSLTGYLRSLLSATAQVFNPLASHLRTLGQAADLRAAFLLGVKISILLALPIATVFVLLGKVFIELWMGPEFSLPSGQVLAILAGAAVIAAPQHVFSSVLFGMGRPGLIASLRVVEALTNLALSIMLVRAVGLIGVAFGTAIPSIVIAVFVLPAMACKIVGVSLPEYYLKTYLRPALAVVPFAVAAIWLRDAAPAGTLVLFFVQVAVLTSLYIPCAFVVALDADERRYVLERIRPARSSA